MTIEPLATPPPESTTPPDRFRMWVVSTSSPGLYARLIRWATFSPVSHSLLVARDPRFVRNKWLAAEATGRGFMSSRVDVRRAAETWKFGHEILLDPVRLVSVYETLLDNSGKRYDWSTIRRWGWASIKNRVTGKRGRWRPRPADDTALYCSEIMAILLRVVGVRGLREGELSPGDLAQDLDDSPDAAKFEAKDLLEFITSELSQKPG